MSATEIILIVIGAAVFLLGYLMPARKKDLDEEVQLISEDEVRKMVAGEVGHVKDKISDIVEETINYSIEKAERAMERVTNEKIMAVNEYSDTVLEEINKNHKEVVFLYDMLNDKHDNLMSAINDATMAADEIKQTTKDASLTANDAADKVDAVMQAADEAAEMMQDAEDAARHAKKAAQETMQTLIKVVMNTKEELKALHEAYPGQEETPKKKVKPVKPAKEEPPVSMPEEADEEVPEDTAPVQEVQQEEGETDDSDSGWVDVTTVRNLAEFIGEETMEDVRYMENPEYMTDVSHTSDLQSGQAPEAEGEDAQSDEDVVPEQRRGYVQDREEQVSEREQEYAHNQNSMPSEQPEAVKQEEEVDFKPISPRRVEIIHQPDGDYIAEGQEDMSTSAAFASMGFFGPKQEEEEEPRRRTRTRKSSRRERMQENPASVDIRFAQGQDNGRNSNERILELHKAGKSNMAIARELGLGLGEVKLVIDLFEGM